VSQDNANSSKSSIRFDLSDSEKQAIELIWINGQSTRREISQTLRVTKMAATNITRSLMDQGLIEETAARKAARGKPTSVFQLVEDSAFAIGVNFSKTSIEIGALNAASELKHTERFALPSLSVDDISALIQEYISSAVKKRRLAAKKICGVGIAVPADFRRGNRLSSAHFEDWVNVDIQAEFQKQFDLPVLVENSGACAAWGERVMGAATNIPYFIFVNIDYGIGGGVVLDGRLVRGAHGNAGVFGVPYPVGTERPSGQDLLDTLRADGIEVNDLPELATLSLVDYPQIETWLDRATDQMQSMLNVLAGAFDPEAIVIGGRLSLEMLDALVERIDNDDFCAVTRRFLPIPKLVRSDLADAGGVAGAAALSLAKVFFTKNSVAPLQQKPSLNLRSTTFKHQ